MHLITISSNFAILIFFAKFSSAQRRDEATVDFIVVGAGVGGCTMASRLSESGAYTVALIESGGFPDPRLEVPVMSPILLENPHPNARVYTPLPQLNAALDFNGTATVRAGLGLGGGSLINGMVFNRGSPHDYDNWANVTGDASWRYDNLLSYFKRSENYMGPNPTEERGYSGPVSVSKPEYAPGEDTFLEGGESLGYPVVDPNGHQQISFSWYDSTQKNGRRVSSYSAYLQPHLSRPNLQVLINSTANKILFDGNRAVGVQFTTNNTIRRIMCSKEVILSAGALETPAVLQRSGIGPASVLSRADVPQLKQLPVGRNLQNHLNLQVDFIINDTSQLFIRERDLTPENYALWEETGDGPYSSWHGLAGQAFLQSPFVPNDSYSGGWSDVRLYPLNSPGVPGRWNVRQDILAGLGPSEVVSGMIVQLTRPKSRGYVAINSSNVEGPPVIDFRYLTHSEDVEVMLAGVKEALKLYETTEAYKRIGARLPQEPLPSCAQLPFRSDDYWRCFIRQRTRSSLHQAGTCPMGKVTDPGAVIDTQLRVIGMEGLRVVDASVMPHMINANFVAALYAIAEKCADAILDEPKRGVSAVKKFGPGRGWRRHTPPYHKH